MGISYLVVFLLRWTVGLITYLVLILFELAFVAGGVALVYKGRELQTNTTPEDHSRDYVIPIYVCIEYDLCIFYTFCALWYSS